MRIFIVLSFCVLTPAALAMSYSDADRESTNVRDLRGPARAFSDSKLGEACQRSVIQDLSVIEAGQPLTRVEIEDEALQRVESAGGTMRDALRRLENGNGATVMNVCQSIAVSVRGIPAICACKSARLAAACSDFFEAKKNASKKLPSICQGLF